MAITYHVYSNDGLGGPIDYTTPVATVSGLTWTSGALPASTSTRYAVRAYDGTNEDLNADAHVDVILDAARADVTRVPFAPRGLVARNIPATGSAANVRLDWSCPSYDREHLPTGFRIYKGTPSVSYATPAATVTYTLGVQHYTATVGNLTDATSYQFAVRAFNASGEEKNTIVATITADATPPGSVDSLAATPTAARGD